MRQLYIFLLYAVLKSMLGVPLISENTGRYNPWDCGRGRERWRDQTMIPELDKSTCSESPHLRKAENDCKRAQMYWPPTVATQYHSFWPTVSPGPSKPVLTEVHQRKKKTQSMEEIQSWRLISKMNINIWCNKNKWCSCISDTLWECFSIMHRETFQDFQRKQNDKLVLWVNYSVELWSTDTSENRHIAVFGHGNMRGHVRDTPSHYFN